MDKSVYAFLQLNEDTEVGEVSHLGGVLAADGVLHFDVLPWVFLKLLDAEAHLALLAIQRQDNCLYLVAHLHEVLCGTQVLAPRHL